MGQRQHPIRRRPVPPGPPGRSAALEEPVGPSCRRCSAVPPPAATRPPRAAVPTASMVATAARNGLREAGGAGPELRGSARAGARPAGSLRGEAANEVGQPPNGSSGSCPPADEAEGRSRPAMTSAMEGTRIPEGSLRFWQGAPYPARPDGAGLHGNQGLWEKSGSRFSRKALRPSWPSAVR